MELRTHTTAERAGPFKDKLVGPSRARTKLDGSCGAARVAERGERDAYELSKELKIESGTRSRGLRLKELPSIEEREKITRKRELP